MHRWTGHSISDADVYHTDEERKTGEKKDPVARFKKELLSQGVLTEKAYDTLEKRVAKEIEEAVEYSENECVYPNPADVFKNVYAQS